MALLIVLISLLGYPILSFILVRAVKNEPIGKKNWFRALFLINVVSVFGFFSKYSTTIPVIDWILITSPFLFICCILWSSQYQSIKLIKYLGAVSMLGIYGFGYILGTVGILGLGFILYEFEPIRRIKIDTHLEYRQTSLGNAISEHRGQRFEIFKQLHYLPIIEKRIALKENKRLWIQPDSIKINYEHAEKKLYLSGIQQMKRSNEIWRDSLVLKK